MDTRKIASHLIREKNGRPTANQYNDMEDIEIAESKDESKSIEEQRNKTRAMTQSLVFKLVALVMCFCLICLGGCFLINTHGVSIESFMNDCKAQGGYFELVEVSPHLESFLRGGGVGGCARVLTVHAMDE